MEEEKHEMITVTSSWGTTSHCKYHGFACLKLTENLNN